MTFPGSQWTTPLPANPPVDQNNSWLRWGMSVHGVDGSFRAHGPAVYRPGPDDDRCVNVAMPAQYRPAVAPGQAWPTTFRVPAGSLVPSSDSDRWLSVVDDAAGLELDLWQANYDPATDTLTSYAGALIDLHADPFDGFVGAPGSGAIGATASGAALTSGLISPADLRSGVIGHALAFSPRWCRQGLISVPATHSDGKGAWWDPPEASRWFLPRSFVIPSSWASVSKMVAKALQEFGAVCVDQGSFDFRFESDATADWSGTDLAGGRAVHYPADLPWNQAAFRPITVA